VQESVLTDESRVPDNDIVKISNELFGYEAFDHISSPDLQDENISKLVHKNKKFTQKETLIAHNHENNTEKDLKKGS